MRFLGRATVVALVGLVLTGCGGGDPGPATTGSTSLPLTTSSAPPQAATDVTLQPTPDSIAVNLDERTITVTVPGQDPLTAPASIGTERNPTPRGRFYVTDRVQPSNPNGAYGPLALGLSAHSDTLSEFSGRDGQIGIHGTNEPSSIGRATSHGCIRVPPAVVELLKLVPLGTPVTIS
jgi:lipoprotein-anchoring transpeptidase ErfK/SrfK